MIQRNSWQCRCSFYVVLAFLLCLDIRFFHGPLSAMSILVDLGKATKAQWTMTEAYLRLPMLPVLPLHVPVPVPASCLFAWPSEEQSDVGKSVIVFSLLPATERVFCIFSRRIRIDAKCIRSATRRNRFMVGYMLSEAKVAGPEK